MALANSRPVILPTDYSKIRLISESKIQAASSKSHEVLNSVKSDSAEKPESAEKSESNKSSPEISKANLSPPTTPPTPKKLKKKYNINLEKQKERKIGKINLASTGISTKIPVTGARPRPDRDVAVDDDVLFTIFTILYDFDAPGTGMTVKQICDVLLEKHPDTAKLSTKTSNLVSAKLNAYVKRVEKGEKNLRYALSREWADTSPKRMVYVYRGILTTDFHLHAEKAMKTLEKSQGGRAVTVSFADSDSEDKLDLRLSPLTIPYEVEEADLEDVIETADISSGSELDAYDMFDENDEFEIERGKRKGGSRVKGNKRIRITAAAAAPRVPKNTSNGVSPSVVTVAASLRAAALHAWSPRFDKWVGDEDEVQRPEDISLEELDAMFG